MAFWSDIAFSGSNVEFLSHMAHVGQLWHFWAKYGIFAQRWHIIVESLGKQDTLMLCSDTTTGSLLMSLFNVGFGCHWTQGSHSARLSPQAYK